ncbi:MAG: hypothetical protein K2N31_10770 [Treponemataceae bacterium]|nr:hypothetical protein [Treponemataceae bacterium]
MLRHPVKKIFGLTVLYSSIIIGIFVLQFKNESVISRSIGLLRMTLAQTQRADGTTALKNTVRVSFKGISFTADDVTPAILLRNAQEPIPLTFVSWEQRDDNAFTFLFSEDVAITFAVSDKTEQAALTVSAQLPRDAERLSLSYKTAEGYSATEPSASRQLISAKNAQYVLSAASFAGETIVLSPAMLTATYALYEPVTTFAFENVSASTPLAAQNLYRDNVQNVRDAVAAIPVETMRDPSQGNEAAVIAYLAEQASRGNYADALKKIPDSFRNSSRRTYLSAPFFNSLVSMNQSLTMVTENMRGMIQHAVAQKNLAVFGNTALVDYMLRESTDADVRSLAALPAALADFAPTVEQASNILRVYVALAKASSALADSLAPVVPACLSVVQDACVFENDTLRLTEKESPLPFLQAVEAGKSLLDYGAYRADQACQICGRLLVNTAFAQASDQDTRALAELYPLLVENSFYPHYSLLGTFGTNKVWAWSAARGLSYAEQRGGDTGTITIDFPADDTHYLIIKGIRPFEGIEIYGMPFRTDPRFESYNSSGYVYDEQTQTLFLKSRHKTDREIIRLMYRRPHVEPQPAPARQSAAQSDDSVPAQPPAELSETGDE